eukprot:jgi/Bigna1/71287/fgenesh1_pg.15_\
MAPPLPGLHWKAMSSSLNAFSGNVYQATGVPSYHLYVGISLVVGSILTRMFGFATCGRCFTFLYLVYMTFKIQDGGPEGEKKEKLYWLSYWAFYGIWTLFDSTTDVICYYARESLVPWIDGIKLLFLAWCLLPQTRRMKNKHYPGCAVQAQKSDSPVGAQQIYFLVIHSGLQKYEARIDAFLGKLRNLLWQVMKELGRLGLEWTLEVLSSMLQRLPHPCRRASIHRFLGRYMLEPVTQTHPSRFQRGPQRTLMPGVNGYQWAAQMLGGLLASGASSAPAASSAAPDVLSSSSPNYHHAEGKEE